MSNEMDALISFFFGLEEQQGQDGHTHCLCLPDGGVTCEKSEMREGAVDFYKTLHTAERCDPACVQKILEGLPWLSPTKRSELDSPVTFQELSEALAQVASGHSPGVDGLLVDFYKSFWSVLGPDWYEVVMECLRIGEVPLSCQRTVLTLLPKKGDLSDLKNWRLVALLCAGIIIFSKSLANWLKE